MKIAFWGSSLVSAYWNGAATYYRGILRALAERGHQISFFEPDAYERQQHRDIPDPEWASVIVYNHEDTQQVSGYLAQSEKADVVVKASGVGVLDDLLESRIASFPGNICKVFWDVDAPATLDRLLKDDKDAFHSALPGFDLVFTYGGGKRVLEEYGRLGAKRCLEIYNAFDAAVHHPTSAAPEFTCDLSFLGNRLPDREHRAEEFFFRPARLSPQKSFLLGGSGWSDKPLPSNVKYAGHIYTRDHNAFNCSARAVLNVSRESMARYGFSPATRVFEAAGAAACLITDEWKGIDAFLERDKEVLVASSGADVANLLANLSEDKARSIGNAARKRVLAEHTYSQRGKLVDSVLQEAVSGMQLAGMRG